MVVDTEEDGAVDSERVVRTNAGVEVGGAGLVIEGEASGVVAGAVDNKAGDTGADEETSVGVDDKTDAAS
jgi:hypothetical protein